MATGSYYREIKTVFWQDAKVSEQMNIHERYLFLYFLTNPHTNLSGLYEITIKQIADESGFSRKDAAALLKRLEELNVIRYDSNTNELLVVNWSRYNWNKSAKILKGVENELSYVKSSALFDSLLKYLTDSEYLIECDDMNRISISYRYSIRSTEKENREKETVERTSTETVPSSHELTSLRSNDLDEISNTIGISVNKCIALYDELKLNRFISGNGEVVQTKEDFISYIKETIHE